MIFLFHYSDIGHVLYSRSFYKTQRYTNSTSIRKGIILRTVIGYFTLLLGHICSGTSANKHSLRHSKVKLCQLQILFLYFFFLSMLGLSYHNKISNVLFILALAGSQLASVLPLFTPHSWQKPIEYRGYFVQANKLPKDCLSYRHVRNLLSVRCWFLCKY